MARPPVDTIHAPAFPQEMRWLNVATLRMDQQRGRPVLIEFTDLFRVSCLRTLPYLRAWHERYAEAGLRVVSVHAPGFAPGAAEGAVRDVVARLGVEHAVALDLDYELWSLYDNGGWPARYLFNGEGKLVEYHFGEGGYADTERAIQEELGIDGAEPMEPLRPEDDPDALVVVPTEDAEGAHNGPYEAGEVWAVLSGTGTVTVNGTEIEVDHAGAYPLIAHPRHTAGVLELTVGDGVVCHATCFAPGLSG